MSVNSTIDLLQALHRAISGVRRAPDHDDYPSAIDTAICPCILVYPGPAGHTLPGINFVMSQRTYLVRCYLGPVGQGSIAQDLPTCGTLLDALRDLYLVPNGLDLDGDVIYVESEAGEVTDTGLRSDILYGAQAYRGFDYRIVVTEKVES